MLNSLIFNNEITVFWNFPLLFQKEFKYKVYFGENFFFTDKTHYEFYSLQPDSFYDIKVEIVDDNNTFVDFIGSLHIKTKKNKHKIDVSLPPYNAVGDGTTLNTGALQKALDDCKVDDYIFIPSGEFLSGCLKVHSNTEIYIDEGGVLKGSVNPVDYLPKIKSRFEGIEQMCYASLINIGELDRDSINCENVIIRGKGKIIGGGRVLADNIIERERKELDDYIKALGDKINEYENINTLPGRTRGRLINVSSAKNIIFSGIDFSNGPAWNLHFIYSQNILTCHCKISSLNVHNGDGWDPDSSHDCTIFDCDFSTSDDCIAIKSGKNPEGNIINIPSYNINIFDIRIQCGYGVSVGSEMSGGVSDIKIWDVFSDFVGITLKAAEKRGGYIKNVKAHNCHLGSVTITATVDYNNDGVGADHFSYLSDFYFENITITGKGQRIFKDENSHIEIYDKPSITISGLGKNNSFIDNVTIKNCILLSSNKFNIDFNNAKNINIINLCEEK